MKHRSLLTAVIVAAFAFAAVPAEAAQGAKAGKRGRPNQGRFMSRFDTDHNGSIDSTEAERVRLAYDAMKKLDTNGDSQLSDSEITAAKIPQRRAGKRQGNKKANA